MATKKHACIHLHEYQPERRDPVTGQIGRQESAVAFGHRNGKEYQDWNEAITDRCYRPTGRAHIVGASRLWNCYAYASTNFGATLLDWMAEHAKDVLGNIIAGDKAALVRLGHGNAIAQCYNHSIMPLNSDTDKRMQVAWAIANFRHYFGRNPEGMWLSECAVDNASLRVLYDAGIKFTILSPHQAWRYREDGSPTWIETHERIDPSRAYKYQVRPGQFITVFFYDKGISQAVAFEKLTETAPNFLAKIKGGFNDTRWHNQLVLTATDGETYGHHVPFGDMALAWVLRELENDPEIELTNPAAFVAQNPATAWVELHEPSAWSCSHGVGRWERNCGCKEGDTTWNQEWRYPLRRAFNWLSAELDKKFEQLGTALFTNDPWDVLAAYGCVLSGDISAQDFVKAHVKDAQSQEPPSRELALKLLETKRYAMLMFTSCGWYFNELSSIEPVQNMVSAAYAMYLLQQVDSNVDLESGFLLILEQAQSNLSVRLWKGADAEDRPANGRDIWEALVRPKIESWKSETVAA